MSEPSSTSVRHMTDLEALMWNLEKDPRLSSTVANLSILDRPVDVDRFRATLERASVVFPRLRQRVSPVFGRLAPPTWELDPNFDINFHLKRVSLRTGSRSELHELVTSLFMTPFDRTRPLWEFAVIDGLRGGKSAMVQRLHHTITDGEGGLRLSLEFIDFSRDAPQREPIEIENAPRAESSLASTLVSSLGDAAVHLTRRQIGVARRTVTSTAQSIVRPTEIPRSIASAVELGMQTANQLNVGDHPMSPLWVDRSLSRTFDCFDVNLATAKAAATRLGGTLNDFFVAGAAAGAGAYHERMGNPVAELRMAMPISHRSDKAIGGNVFSPSQSLMPTGPMSPRDRFTEVHSRLQRTKRAGAVDAVGAFAGIINLLPTSVVARTGYRFAGTIDFVTSNLRAAPMDTFIAGALMEANYPLGPLAATAFNLTTMSYRGSFNMGVVIDTAAIEDPAMLISSLKAGYRDLLKAGSKR